MNKPTFDGYLLIDHRYAERFAAGNFLPTRQTLSSDALCDADNLPYQRTANGVAVIEIMGPLLQYGGWWWDGHEAIKSRCLAALGDSLVHLLVLRIDSPGGVAAGCFDAVRAVRAAALAAGKDIIVWCGGDGAYSAGYAWACAGSEIAVPDTGGLGSVGVLSTMWDRTASNDMQGYKVVVIRSGQKKAEGHPDVPLTDGAVAREQAVVDGMALIFAGEIVAPTREQLSTQDVLSYEGECFYGQTAVDKGLSDEVMPWDEFLSLAEARAKERRMQKIMGRLGLAADASEEKAIEKIDKIEQAKTENEAKATALAVELADVLLEQAHKDGKITAAEKEPGAPGGLREMGQRDPQWLRAHLSTRVRLQSLPGGAGNTASPPASPPANGGGAAAGKGEEQLAKDYEALSNVERAALAESDPKAFAAMRAAWRKTKGMRAPAQADNNN